MVGTQYYAFKVPGNAWNNFKGLSLENKATYIGEEVVSWAAMGPVGKVVANVAKTIKTTASIAKEALPTLITKIPAVEKIVTATGEALSTVGGSAVKASGKLGEAAEVAMQDANNVLGELASGARGAEEVALAGGEGNLPSSMMQEGENLTHGSSNLSKEATNLGYAEAETPELSKGFPQRRATYKTVKDTGENCRIVRPLKDTQCPVWADKKYEAIRSCGDDVSKIANNTGWSPEKIARIKDHSFYKEHILKNGISRFGADHEIAAAWDRLYHGDFIQNDIQLLEHEFFESRFESLYKTDYDTAHEAAIKNNKIWSAPSWKD